MIEINIDLEQLNHSFKIKIVDVIVPKVWGKLWILIYSLSLFYV